MKCYGVQRRNVDLHKHKLQGVEQRERRGKELSEERASENTLKEKRCLSNQSKGYVSLAGVAEVRLGLAL